MSKLIEETEELPRLTPLGKNWMEEDSEGYYLNREYVLEIIKRHEAQEVKQEPVAIDWQDIIQAIMAVDAEAMERGRMYPQNSDEQNDDRRCVRRVCGMLTWYATNGGAVAMRLPNWPKYSPQAQPQDAQIALDAARYRKFKRLHEQPDAPLHGECAAEINRLQEQVRVLREALLNVAESDIPEPCWCDPRDKKEFPNVQHAAYCVNATKALSVTPDHVVDGVQHDDYPVDGWSEK